MQLESRLCDFSVMLELATRSNTLAAAPTDRESKNGRSRDHSSCYNATTRESWVQNYTKCNPPRGSTRDAISPGAPLSIQAAIQKRNAEAHTWWGGNNLTLYVKSVKAWQL